jgi:hypothetical protein
MFPVFVHILPKMRLGQCPNLRLLLEWHPLPGPEKLFGFLGAAAEVWSASGQYLTRNQQK